MVGGSSSADEGRRPRRRTEVAGCREPRDDAGPGESREEAERLTSS